MAAVVSLDSYPYAAPRRVPALPTTRPTRSHRDAAVYRRRRLVAAAVGIGLVLAAGRAGAALGGSTTLAPAERRPQVVTVVVEQGDTLWTIAQRLAPDADTREVVDAIVQARGTAAIMPGETITWLER